MPLFVTLAIAAPSPLDNRQASASVWFRKAARCTGTTPSVRAAGNNREGEGVYAEGKRRVRRNVRVRGENDTKKGARTERVRASAEKQSNRSRVPSFGGFMEGGGAEVAGGGGNVGAATEEEGGHLHVTGRCRPHQRGGPIGIAQVDHLRVQRHNLPRHRKVALPWMGG